MFRRIASRLTPIRVAIVLMAVLTIAAITASHWPADTTTAEPPRTYAEAISMRNAAFNAMHRLIAECDSAEPNSTQQKRLVELVNAKSAEIVRIEQRITELKN
jgi:hypothetical protein